MSAWAGGAVNGVTLLLLALMVIIAVFGGAGGRH